MVIKGLKPKFGELTEQNEREFRSFFDKIIQLPFSMPVASYSVDTFLVDALKKIEFFTEEELKDTSLAEDLSEITRLSVGTNPRSLKRLTNTLALISIINRKQRGSESSVNRLSKLINYSLVCMQIAYPYIYNQLGEEPDFKSWNEKTASRLKLRPLKEEEKERLDATEEFDEEWEKIVFRMCQKETYLSNRVFSISLLFNKIAEIVGNNEHLGEIIEATLEMSAVTNLKAFDTPVKKVGMVNRDQSDYKFNGVLYTKKVQLVNDVVAYYLSQHPGTTYEQLKEAFSYKKNMESVFMDYERYKEIKAEKGKVEFFGNKTEEDCISLADRKILICSNWPTMVNGKPADFAKLLEVLKNRLGYTVETC